MDTTSAALEHRVNALIAQFEQEGVLDSQFGQLLQLQDDTNPDFVAEVVQLYFEDSSTKIAQMGQMLSTLNPDFNELDQLGKLSAPADPLHMGTLLEMGLPSSCFRLTIG